METSSSSFLGDSMGYKYTAGEPIDSAEIPSGDETVEGCADSCLTTVLICGRVTAHRLRRYLSGAGLLVFFWLHFAFRVRPLPASRMTQRPVAAR